MMMTNATMTLSDGTEHPIEVIEISINGAPNESTIATIAGRVLDIEGATFEATFEGLYNDVPKKVTNWKKIIEGG